MGSDSNTKTFSSINFLFNSLTPFRSHQTPRIVAKVAIRHVRGWLMPLNEDMDPGHDTLGELRFVQSRESISRAV